MDRVAVFVDAGYLFAQGSAVLIGKKVPRGELSLDIEQALAAFEDSLVALLNFRCFASIERFEACLRCRNETPVDAEVSDCPQDGTCMLFQNMTPCAEEYAERRRKPCCRDNSFSWQSSPGTSPQSPD
jgi:hypothetical protein